MKTLKAKLIMLMAVAMPLVFSIGGCDKDDDDNDNNNNNNNNTSELDYHAHINSPNSDAKHVGDTLQIKVEFEEHNGGTVHHINVRIFNSDSTDQVIYDKPAEEHVHADSPYEYEDMLVLSNANGVTEHTNWMFVTKVWGHDDGVSEELDTVSFHVHPMVP